MILDRNMIILGLLLIKFHFFMTYWCKLADRLRVCRVVPSFIVRGKLLTMYKHGIYFARSSSIQLSNFERIHMIGKGAKVLVNM